MDGDGLAVAPLGLGERCLAAGDGVVKVEQQRHEAARSGLPLGRRVYAPVVVRVVLLRGVLRRRECGGKCGGRRVSMCVRESEWRGKWQSRTEKNI